MEKFLEIYNDADDNYVLISVNRIKHVVKNNSENTWIRYNGGDSEARVQIVTTPAESSYLIQDTIVDAVAKIASEDYTKSSLKVKLPLEVTSISTI
jgi:hypothetical protein